jgi:LPPG:FO 2-phospho-L-lactate transferase
MNVVALAGGVGGAKLAHGLAMVLPPESLTVVVNTGDDFEHLGFHISPDVDTVLYTLAGLANAETGWGLAGETWSFLDALGRLGGETWFRLGDRDLATHVERRRRLLAGQSLTEVTRALCAALGVRAAVLPMSDDRLRTLVQTDEGELGFQEYFVHRQCRPKVTGFVFDGLERARPSAQVVQALTAADLVVLCPSNPFVSLGPILALPGVKELVRARLTLAVSPIVAGQALKGPAGKMLAELGLESSATAVAQYYDGLLRLFVLDELDESLSAEVRGQGLRVLVTDTIMRSDAGRARLAQQVLDFAGV